MSRRRADARNRIRGPQSALTDFLAANNISAAQISADYQQRLNNARQNAANGDYRNEDEDEEDNNDDDEEEEDDDDVEDPAEQKKRKRKEEKMLQKIKQTKEFKRRKHESGRGGGSDDSDGADDGDDDDDALARSMMPKNKKAKKQVVKLPGQLDNCELCGKRFTVTPYSKAGPAGGLLCPKCSKEAKDDEKARQKAAAAGKKKATPRARRRQTESDRMMGDVRPGAKSLMDCCVRKVADVVNDIDDFGDMPQRLLDRLSQILSKKRVLTSRTLGLFLRADSDTIDVYDSGKLEEEDFQRIFAHMAHVASVNLRFAGQMKDDALLYMADKCTQLRHLQLGAANLISDAAWVDFFVRRGAQLESLKLSELNDSLHHDTVLLLTHHCTQLRRLKMRACTHMTDASIAALASLTQLEHLTLSVATDTTTADTLNKLIATVGPNLRTLCLESFDNINDSTLASIHTHCHRLSKLRLTGSSQCTDAAFAALFTSWPNPPLPYLDLSSNRDDDEVRADAAPATNPADQQTESPDNPETIGLGSAALRALMRHSGSALQRLDLHSNRHIGIDALLDVFDGQTQYSALRDIDLSFVPTVDDVVMRGIFRSCPKLKKLALFACFNARAAAGTIPAGVAVIGLPNAHDHIVQGEEGL